MAGLISITAAAQDKNQHLYWDHDHLLRVDWKGTWLLEARRAGVAPKSGRVQFPGVAVMPHYVDGAFYVTTPFVEEKDGRPTGLRGLRLLRSLDGSTWETWAFYEAKPGVLKVTGILVLGSDHLVLVPGMSDFPAPNGRFSKIALGRRKERQGGAVIQVEQVVDMGLPESLSKRQGLGGGFGFIFNPWTVQIPGGFALVHAKTGYVWSIFRESEGVKTRVSRIFPWVEDLLVKGKPMETVILDAQPTQEGNLLVASRVEGAVLATTAYVEESSLPQPTPKGMALADAAQSAVERAQMLQPQGRVQHLAHWRSYPQLKWFEIDPSSGQVREVFPPGGPSTLPDQPPFAFTLSMKGRVIPQGASSQDTTGTIGGKKKGDRTKTTSK